MDLIVSKRIIWVKQTPTQSVERGHNNTRICLLYSLVAENTTYMLRNCVKSQLVWMCLVPHRLRPEFFSDDCEQWLI